ncbi:molybdenum cofactor guanylyltransferase [bacterium]|jgi:molybdopterin-guanine dinucleotide biosynthesis protein A|nr:molybdenum cofactor guanylyltransferase [bacterium]
MAPNPPEACTRFSAVLLTGGRSLRMGLDKALLPHPSSGQPLVLHQLETLRAAGAKEVFLSIRNGTDYPQVSADLSRLHDDGSRGPMAGIAAALAAAREPHLLVLAVDLPDVTPALLRKWLARAPKKQGFVPIGPQGSEPLCALYPRTARPFFDSALASDRLALRNVVTAMCAVDLLYPMALTPEEYKALTNWNSPADLTGGLNR